MARRPRHRRRPGRTCGGRVGRAAAAPARAAQLGRDGALGAGAADAPPGRRAGGDAAPDRAAAPRLPVGSRADGGRRSCRTRSRRPTRWPRRPAAAPGAKLVDELGDLLFQTFFLALLCEEQGDGDLAAVADGHHRQADPPPPARVRRAGGRDGRGPCAQLGADQARRRGPNRHLPRRPRGAAGAAPRPQAAAAGVGGRLRLARLGRRLGRPGRRAAGAAGGARAAPAAAGRA